MSIKKIIGAIAGGLGATAETLEAVVFTGIVFDRLPAQAFPPLSVSLLTAALPAPLVEEARGKKVLRVLGYLPAVAANVAAFGFEGSAAAAIFTGVVGSCGVLTLAEIGYKKYYGEEITRLDVVEYTAKMAKFAAIGFTLNYQGTGKVLELALNHSVPVTHKVASTLAAGVASIGASIGFFRSGKALKKFANECCDDPQPQVYKRMEEGCASIQTTPRLK